MMAAGKQNLDLAVGEWGECFEDPAELVALWGSLQLGGQNLPDLVLACQELAQSVSAEAESHEALSEAS